MQRRLYIDEAHTALDIFRFPVFLFQPSNIGDIDANMGTKLVLGHRLQKNILTIQPNCTCWNFSHILWNHIGTMNCEHDQVSQSSSSNQLRLSLALLFISPVSPSNHTPTRGSLFSSSTQLYMKIEYSRQSQHEMAVSVQAELNLTHLSPSMFLLFLGTPPSNWKNTKGSVHIPLWTWIGDIRRIWMYFLVDSSHMRVVILVDINSGM